MTASDRSFRITPRLLAGVALLGVGVLFMLRVLIDFDASRVLRFWPVAWIVLGATILWNGGRHADDRPQRGQARLSGWFWILAGSWFLLDRLGWLPFDPWDVFWPLLMLVVGSIIVWRAIRGGAPAAAGTSGTSGTPGTPFAANYDNSFSAFAVMSGVNLRNASKEFRGGEATAVMGGVEIDLRDAQVPSGQAVIDVFALWGGVEIKVPASWHVSSEVMPLMGSYEDKTRPPAGTDGPRLVLKGFAIMGGVDVGN